MPVKVGLVSLGCPKNLVDSEVMLGMLAKRQYHLTRDESQADLLIVNTCGFIDRAKEESVDTILEMARQKKKGRCKALIVTGCLVQRHAEELKKEIPEIDAFLGSADYPKILEVAERVLAEDRRKEALVDVHSPVYLYDENTPRLLCTPSYTAYLKIAEGCDHACRFCIIPTLRGRMRSRSVESCVAEARNLAALGVKELNLISQDTSEYGRDLYGQPRLAQLLGELSRVEGLRWIRMHYLYPAFLTDELLEVWSGSEKLVKYVDIPLQHGDGAMLKAMARPGTRESNLKLVERLRRALPGAAIRSSFIVGYPGETEERFEGLLGFLREARLDRVGVFTYSREAGTPAAEMEGQVPDRTKQRRRREAMALASEISAQRLKERLGREVDVLVEDKPGAGHDGMEHGEGDGGDRAPRARGRGRSCLGRTALDAPDIDGRIHFSPPAGGAPRPGDFVHVRVEDCDEHDLFGRQVA